MKHGSLKYLLFIFLCLTWGSSYILIKKALITFEPVELAVIRIGVASVCLLAFLPAAIRSIPRKLWLYLIFPGWIGAGIPSYLFAKAETQISSAMTGILGSLTPLMTLLVGLVFFGQRFRAKELIGICLGLLGAVLIITDGRLATLDSDLVPSLLVVGGAICYAFSTNAVHRWLKGINTIHISAMAFAFILPVCLVYILTRDVELLVSRAHFGESLGYLVVLSVFSTVVASIVYFRLVQIAGPTFSSLVSYFIPIIAIFFGLMDGESLHWIDALGMGCIFLGVFLARLS